ncbi:PTS system fructose subfamily IIA component [gamma proteobacterium HTCC5015]|nr:PTS system fructose subfamily IIA component [gamma proteobacterium HTCC5015]
MLVTHPGVGRMLLETAESILKRTVDDIECFEVPLESDPEERITAAKALRKKLDHGQGVLLLNDLYGATPFNVARAIEEPQHVLTGLNLCMLLRAINYQQHALDELANIAREGGQKGLCFAEQPEGKPRD